MVDIRGREHKRTHIGEEAARALTDPTPRRRRGRGQPKGHLTTVGTMSEHALATVPRGRKTVLRRDDRRPKTWIHR